MMIFIIEEEDGKEHKQKKNRRKRRRVSGVFHFCLYKTNIIINYLDKSQTLAMTFSHPFCIRDIFSLIGEPT